MQRPSPLDAPTTTVRDIFALSCNEPRRRHSVSAAMWACSLAANDATHSGSGSKVSGGHFQVVGNTLRVVGSVRSCEFRHILDGLSSSQMRIRYAPRTSMSGV